MLSVPNKTLGIFLFALVFFLNSPLQAKDKNKEGQQETKSFSALSPTGSFLKPLSGTSSESLIQAQSFSSIETLFAPSLESKIHAKGEVVSQQKAFSPKHKQSFAVLLKLDPDWHIYFKNPGDSGLETRVQWRFSGASNKEFEQAQLHWPVPDSISSASEKIVSYGYHDQVLLPFDILIPPELSLGSTQKLELRVEYLACNEVCIPESLELSFSLLVSDTAEINPNWEHSFLATPYPQPKATQDWNFYFDTSSSSLCFTLPKSQSPPKTATFFSYDSFLIQSSHPQILNNKGQHYQLQLSLEPDAKWPTVLNGILKFDNQAQGWAVSASSKPLLKSDSYSPFTLGSLSENSSFLATSSISLGLALIFAFLGGLLLNFMPCVLPVLSIKILAFVQQSKEKRSSSLLHGLLFALGVLLSFWLLLGLLLLLRAGGDQLGWGFQLQEPAFVLFLSFFMLFFAFNLMGFFELGTGLVGLGPKRMSGLGSSFLTGVTATVVATPCSGPFMGSALGFALAEAPWISFLVFTLMALGLALPYVLLAAFPAWLRFLPKPGAWMESFKQLMAFPLLITVVWLNSLLGHFWDIDSLTRIYAIQVLLAAVFWTLFRLGQSRPVLFRLVLGAGLFMVFVLFQPLVQNFKTLSSEQLQEKVQWETYSDEALTKALSEQKAVFVDFTAAWCLSCLVNKKVALEQSEIEKAFKQKNIQLFKADWTKRDPAISRALARFGRQSVPLYLYYPKGQQEPIILPSILTPAIVLEALEQSRAQP